MNNETTIAHNGSIATTAASSSATTPPSTPPAHHHPNHHNHHHRFQPPSIISPSSVPIGTIIIDHLQVLKSLEFIPKECILASLNGSVYAATSVNRTQKHTNESEEAEFQVRLILPPPSFFLKPTIK